MIMPAELKTLFQHFSDGAVTSDWNFNFHNDSVSLPLSLLEYDHDIPGLLIAFASHEITHGSHMVVPIINFFHRESLRLKVNRFTGKHLSHKDYKLISEAIGYGSNRLKIAQNFVQLGYDMNYIRNLVYSNAELITA